MMLLNLFSYIGFCLIIVHSEKYQDKDCGCSKLNRPSSSGDAGEGLCQKSSTQVDDPMYNEHALSLLRGNPMVEVKGGTFFMGTLTPYLPQDGEGLFRETTLSQYYLDKQEVSNAEFEAFVLATGYTTEVNRNKMRFYRLSTG